MLLILAIEDKFLYISMHGYTSCISIHERTEVITFYNRQIYILDFFPLMDQLFLISYLEFSHATLKMYTKINLWRKYKSIKKNMY